MCSRCNGFKPARAHHCSQCDRCAPRPHTPRARRRRPPSARTHTHTHAAFARSCVMKMDHHCPWVNNCVGANNQKHFVLFVGYTALLSLYALVLLVCRMLAGAGRTGQRGSFGTTPAEASHVLLMSLLFFEALLFGLFTTAMFVEQMSSILSDQVRWSDRRSVEPSPALSPVALDRHAPGSECHVSAPRLCHVSADGHRASEA